MPQGPHVLLSLLKEPGPPPSRQTRFIPRSLLTQPQGPLADFPPVIHYSERQTATLRVPTVCQVQGPAFRAGCRHAWGPRSAGARLLYGTQWCPSNSCPPINEVRLGPCHDGHPGGEESGVGVGCRNRRWQRQEGCAPSPGPLRMPATLEATQRQEGLSLRAAGP